MKYLTLLLLILSLSLHAQSQHPIQEALDSCYNTMAGSTTIGTIECQQQAEAAWDAEMNKYYQLLMDSLPTWQQEQLRNAQRKWLAYRDEEFAWTNQFYLSMQGTLYKIVAASRRREIVQERALELAWYYEMIEPQE
jgi:uncharacterized protein YecT (DUF1311 family)